MQRKKISVMAMAPLFLAGAAGCDGTMEPFESGVESSVRP